LNDAQKLALVDALENLDIHTFYGPIKFSKEGEFFHANTGLTPLALQIQGGKTVIIGPASVQEAKAQYPMKPWN
jgi:branched-chain amino acid transport system substrate-binding protein